MIALCAAAFVRAMVSLPPEEIFFLSHCHNDPNDLCLRDEDTIFLWFEDLGNKFPFGPSLLASPVANPEAYALDLQDTPLRSAFTGLLCHVQ